MAVMLTMVVFLGEDQSVKLGDFGLSKLMQSHDFASTYVGTPFYMSPEICAAERYTQSSDIWSVGCIMYELCTKEPPFNAKTHLQLVQRIRKGDFKPIAPHYSKDLRDAVAQCLRTNPDARPDTSSLLGVPYVWMARKQQEMIDLGKILKTKEESADEKLKTAEERLSAMEADRATMYAEVESTVRREWEVKARLEIDRQVQLELERLRLKFDKEVDEKVRSEMEKVVRKTERKVMKEIKNPPALSLDKENLQPQGSFSTMSGEDDFPSTTDLTDLSELSMQSPVENIVKPQRKKTKMPFGRSKTCFDSPSDVAMGEPSPMSISGLALSPRRNAAADGSSKNIFAEAAKTKAKWEPTLAYTSDDEDDIPDLPSPTRPKFTAADPFKVPARPRPGLMRQNTTATMQRLTAQPTLFPTTGNAGVLRVATISNIPRTVTEPDLRNAGSKSPNRRLSKIPSSTNLQEGGSPPRRLPSKVGAKPKDGADDIHKAVLQRNIIPAGGRTLVELAQARAGGRPLSSDMSRPFERDLPPPPVWDPERDEMPSPFIRRTTKVISGFR